MKITKSELRQIIREEIKEAAITDPRMNNPNPTQGVFSIKDRTGNKYNLVAHIKGKFVNYYKVLGWNKTSGTPFNIDRLNAKLPKHKIDADKIVKVVEDNGYTVDWYELT